jgi:LPS-assembly protein
MKFSRWGRLLLTTMAVLARAETASPLPEEPVRISSRDGFGQVEIDPATGSATATQGVVVEWLGSTLQAQTASVDQLSGDGLAEGDVVVDYVDARGVPQRWRGARVKFNFRTRLVTAENFRFGRPPLFLAGERLQAAQDATNQVAEAAMLTTDDLHDPGYRVKAHKFLLHPGQELVAEDAILYFGSLPVMYFPKYTRSLVRHPNFWTVTPGFRSLYGPFFLSTYHWNVRTNLEVTVDLDARQRRGLGGGPGLNYNLDRFGQGRGRFYYTRDDAPELGNPLNPPDNDRHRYDFRHAVTNGSGLAFKALARGQSDSLVWRDFFEGEFRTDPQPKSFFELSQQWSNWTFDLIAQPQLNDFFRTVERLPDARLSGLRQQIGVTPLYYESESSLAYLRFRDALPGGTNFAAFRADTFHQILAPRVYFNWLNVTPRAGARFTHYGDPDGLNTVDGDRNRWVYNAGVDVHAKASRLWPRISNRALDLNGLRHIVEPSVSYVYVPRPDVTPTELPQFDRELITPRLLPLHFPDYTQIDSVDSQNTLRFGLRNKLQTKREGRVENVLNWAAYTDWRLRPRADQTTFPDLFSDFDFAPRSWALFTSEMRYDIHSGWFREANHRLTLQPGETWSWAFGHRYLRDDFSQYGPGNNVVFSSFYLRLNENWGLRTVHQFETRDGILEEQQYQVYRDLRSWTVALALRLRDNRGGASDWTIGITFSLKAFPRFGLGGDSDRPFQLMGL